MSADWKLRLKKTRVGSEAVEIAGYISPLESSIIPTDETIFSEKCRSATALRLIHCSTGCECEGGWGREREREGGLMYAERESDESGWEGGSGQKSSTKIS